MTTTNLYTAATSSSTLATLASLAASPFKLVAAVNNKATTVAALAVAGTTGALATYMAESHHQHSLSYAHPHTAGSDTATTSTGVNKILYHNANNSSNYITNKAHLNGGSYNNSLPLLAPALNMTHNHIIARQHHSNSNFSDSSGRSLNTTTLVDGLFVDHMPLQLITSTASSKINLDIEIDIQLLTSDYEGSTVSLFFKYYHLNSYNHLPKFIFLNKSVELICVKKMVLTKNLLNKSQILQQIFYHNENIRFPLIFPWITLRRNKPSKES